MGSPEHDAARPLRIGSLAGAAGVGTETIRYYQRRGLLGRPQKPFGGQRAYPPEYVERVRFIKRAQALGFSLAEIAALLTLDSGTGHARARELATKRLLQIETKLDDLHAMHAALADLVERCGRAEGKVACPIVAALAAPAATRSAKAPSAGRAARSGTQRPLQRRAA